MFAPVFIFSIVTVFSTWLLLIVGGLVNPMGASMACPDWYFIPTCNGQILPQMVGGVLYEHGHRLVASAVGLCTLALALMCWRSPRVDVSTKRLTLLALGLVVLQGTFGGLTVLLKLSALISTLHLLCAMAFFSLLICISFRLSPSFRSFPSLKNSSWGLLLAIGLTAIQLIWGGVIRHVGAGLACGDDLVGCGPSIWPSWAFGQLHMAHRFIGYGLFFVILFSCLKCRKYAKSHGHTWLKYLTWLPIFLTFCQIGLGLLTIHTLRSAHVVALHTGFGGLLLASLLTVYLLELSSKQTAHGRVAPSVI